MCDRNFSCGTTRFFCGADVAVEKAARGGKSSHLYEIIPIVSATGKD
jgi:hypothetical protein